MFYPYRDGSQTDAYIALKALALVAIILVIYRYTYREAKKKILAERKKLLNISFINNS